MTKSTGIRLLSLVLIPAFIIGVSCSQDTGGAEVSKAALGAIAEPSANEGIVAFCSGDVVSVEPNGETALEIGDPVRGGQTIRVGSGGSCELQFPGCAVVRIQEDTILEISVIDLSSGSSSIGMAMATGSVLCKVRKLVEGESFAVTTPSIVCGVRGTEFVLRSSGTGQSAVAVKSGAVAVLPKDIDPSVLADHAVPAGSVIDPTLSALLDSVGHENAIVVSADQELVLTEESLAETRAASQRLTRLVSEAAASGSVDARVLERLRTDIESSLLAAVKTIPAPAAASGGFEADFKTIDSLEWIEFAPASGPTVSLPPLVGIVVAAEPEDSEILVDGVVRGKGRYSGLFRAGTVLDVLVRREGFADHSMRIDTAETGGTEYTVRLKEVPGNKNEGGTGEYRSSDTDRPSPDAEQTAAIAIPAASSAAPAAPATPEASSAAPASASPTAAATTAQPAAGPTPVPAAGTVPSSAAPSAAPTAPATPASSSAAPASEAPSAALPSSAAPASASPTAAAATAQPAAGPTPVSTAGTPPTSGIAPEKGRAAKEPSPSPVQSSAASASQSTALPERIKVSAMPLSGALALSTDLLVATDRTGTVYAFSPAGTLIWSVTTANNPNTVSFPVVAGNRVIFSGSREIVILDAANGSVVHRRALGSDESHGSGRRCAMAGSLVIMPSDSRIQFLDSASGQIRSSVVIPDGTRMSPAVWKDRAVIASQTGTLYVMNPRGGSTEMILRTNASQPEILSPLIWNDLAILVGKRGVVVCVDLVQQRVVWERRLLEGLSYVTDPAASEIGVYILGSDRIFGLSWRDGSDIFPPIAGAGAPAAVIAGRLAYASVKGGMVLADPMTGKPLTTVPLAEDASDTAGTTGIAGTTRPVDIHGKIGIGTAAGTILIVNP